MISKEYGSIKGTFLVWSEITNHREKYIALYENKLKYHNHNCIMIYKKKKKNNFFLTLAITNSISTGLQLSNKENWTPPSYLSQYWILSP